MLALETVIQLIIFPPITSIDLYGLSSHSLDIYQIVEAIQPLLTVMLGPHYLENPFEYDQIHLPLQDSHLNSMPLIEKLSS